MKAINGKLNMTKRYKLIDVCYGACFCDNCGNNIKNIAVVADEEENTYKIGLDCMETIINMHPDEKQQAINEINTIKRFIKILKNEIFTIIIYQVNDVTRFRGYRKSYLNINDLKREGKFFPGFVGGDYEYYKDLISNIKCNIFEIKGEVQFN